MEVLLLLDSPLWVCGSIRVILGALGFVRCMLACCQLEALHLTLLAFRHGFVTACIYNLFVMCDLV